MLLASSKCFRSNCKEGLYLSAMFHTRPHLLCAGWLLRMGRWFVMLWLLSMQYGEVDAFFDWLKEPAPAPAPPQESIAPILLHGETPAFEMSVVDEKFLAEAKQMELSPLDSCHFRVSTMRMASYFQEFHNQQSANYKQ